MKKIIRDTSLLLALPAGMALTSAASVAAEPNYGGDIIVGSYGGEPVLFNPLYSEDTASGEVEDLLYAGLTRTNEELEVVPVVAKSDPVISEDGLEWTFEMHEDVAFHDGHELTADDVVFTYNIFLHEDYTGPRASNFTSLEKVEALDEHTVRFTLSEPDARFATYTFYGILPEHVLGDVPVAELGEYNDFNIDQPIGAGPFEFVEWKQGQYLKVVANEDYFEGRPYLDSVTIRYAQDANAAVLMLGEGEVDHLAGLPPAEVPTVESFDAVDVHSTLALRYDYLGYNLRRDLFKDKRVRQAITHAIDRELIVETVMEGQATVAHAPMSPLSWAYNDNVPRFEYDLEKSRALLKEAGWEPGPDGILVKDGKRFSFDILSNDGNNVRRDLGIIVKQMLADVGIEVRPAQMEWGAFLDKIQGPDFDYDAMILAWALGTDPDPTSIWHSDEIENGLNMVGFNNPELDAVAESNIRILDQEKRAQELAKAWEILAEEQPYTFMWYPQQFVGLNKRIQGFTHHPRNNMYDVEGWWVAQQ